VVYSNISGVVYEVVRRAENCPGREICFAFSLNFFLKNSKNENGNNTCKYMKSLPNFRALLFGIVHWRFVDCFFVFRHFSPPNIVFLLGWEG
jgi:hypothetical protein